MIGRLIAAGALVVATAACETPTPPRGIAGPYALVARDGFPLPCCAYAPIAGEVITLDYGELDLLPSGAYRWRMTQRLVSGGTAQLTSSIFSSGKWTRDGGSLNLSDSTTGDTITGVISGSALALRTPDHRYDLLRIPSRAIAGQYDLIGVDGRLPCCVFKDSAGSVVVTVGGGLQVGGNGAAGTYAWWLVKESTRPDGTTHSDQVTFSSGTYTWDGMTLTLEDSVSSSSLVGGVLGSHLIFVDTPFRQYEFTLLVPSPR